MKPNYKRIPARFGPETRFEVKPVPVAPFRVEEESELEKLKGRLLRERLTNVCEPDQNSLVRRAANEAVALAWVTPFPLLVFPTLFEEKIDAALHHAVRQQTVWARSRELLAA